MEEKLDNLTETVMSSLFYDLYRQDLEPKKSTIMRQKLLKDNNFTSKDQINRYRAAKIMKYKPLMKKMNQVEATASTVSCVDTFTETQG